MKITIAVPNKFNARVKLSKAVSKRHNIELVRVWLFDINQLTSEGHQTESLLQALVKRFSTGIPNEDGEFIVITDNTTLELFQLAQKRGLFDVVVEFYDLDNDTVQSVEIIKGRLRDWPKSVLDASNNILDELLS